MIRGGRREHPVAGLRRAAAFGDDHAQRLVELARECGSVRAMPSGSVLSMKGSHPVAGRLAEGVGDELGPSAEPPMPMDSTFLNFARSAADLAAVDVGRQTFDASEIFESPGDSGVGASSGSRSQ